MRQQVVKILHIAEVTSKRFKTFTVIKCIKILLGDQRHQNQVINDALTPSMTTKTAHLRHNGFWLSFDMGPHQSEFYCKFKS
jgi:hypothetical protein